MHQVVIQFHHEMGVYRLTTLEDCACETACGVPLVTTIRRHTDDATTTSTSTDVDVVDFIDEILNGFRANILHRTFDVRSPSDRLLAYLTFFASDALRKYAEKCPDKRSAIKAAKELACERFACPGEADFEFGALLPAPETREEMEKFRAFARRCREEIAVRLVERCYDDVTGAPDKFWMAFAKRKFLNR
jgi:actin related protein 2/3 complex subunit 3